MRRLIAFACLLVAPPGRAADYTVVVLDASTSMSTAMGGGTRMEVAKRALSRALSGRKGNLGILVFQDGLADPWVYPLGPIDEDGVSRAIRLPFPDGGTPLGDYMKIGADALLRTRAANHNLGAYKLIVATDGEADNRDQVDRFNQDIRSRGIEVAVIGVGMDADHSLATRVDFYQNAADEASLTRALRHVLAETPDSGDKASDFVEGELDPRVARAAFEELSTFRNQPIGESPPVVAAAPGPVPTPAGVWAWNLVVLFTGGLAIFFGVLVMLKTLRDN